MRFATLVALAVVVSSTPGLAAPLAPHRAHPDSHHAHPDHAAHARAVTSDHHGHPGPHHAHPDHAAHARAVTSDHLSHPAHPGSHHAHPDHTAHARAITPDNHPGHSAHPDPHHAHPDHVAHARAVTSDHPSHPAHPGLHHAYPDHAAHARAITSDHPSHPAHPGPHHAHPSHAAHARAVTSDIVQAIEAAFDSLPPARKREVITTALQELESLGLSRSGSTVDKRFKLPEISPSTESALNNAANVATIGGGIAKIGDTLDGSSSNRKRQDEPIAKIWDSINYNDNYKREFVEPDERAFKIPASVTTWLKSLGNVASIGAGGAAIVGAVDGGSNSTLKREFDQAFDGVELATPLNGATSQFENRGKISSSETPSTSEVSGVESVLGTIAGAFSLGGTGATVFSSLEGSSNNTKRFFTQVCGVPTFSVPDLYNLTERDALHGVDIATLLDGAAPQFEDRSLTPSELSELRAPACA